MEADRIIIIHKKDDENGYYKCDLCDKSRYPFLSWGCYHDDDAHKTAICLSCIIDLNNSIPDKERHRVIMENLADYYEKGE